MILKKTPEGFSYYDSELTNPNLFVYFHGYNENPLVSSFYKVLYPFIKDKVRVIMAVNPFYNAGWEKPHNGVCIGTLFKRFFKSLINPKVYILTGYSAGADPDYILLEDDIQGFVSVAGKSDQYQNMQIFAKKGIPVLAFAGTADTSENSYKLCEKTWVTWFQTMGGSLQWTVFPNISHGSVDDKAYSPDSGILEWLDKLITPAPVEIPVSNPVVREGFLVYKDSSGNEYKTPLA